MLEVVQLLWEQDGAQPLSQEQAAQGTVLGAAVPGPGSEGSAHTGSAPDTSPAPLLLSAGSRPRAGCISVNWQLNLLLPLALSKEMKLVMVLQVTELVHKGSVWEIIAANPNFLCRLSV